MLLVHLNGRRGSVLRLRLLLAAYRLRLDNDDTHSHVLQVPNCNPLHALTVVMIRVGVA